MPYYTKHWTVMKGEERIMIIFITKKDALGWIAEQDNPEEFHIIKESM